MLYNFFRLCQRGLSYSPSICSERYCVMLPTPVFVSPWFYSRLLFLLCQYENTPAHAFLVSNSIAGLVAWGGGCCYVGLYFLHLLSDCFHSAFIIFTYSSLSLAICSWLPWRGTGYVPVLDPSDDVADCCLSRCYKNFACSCFLGFRKSQVDVYGLLVLISLWGWLLGP